IHRLINIYFSGILLVLPAFNEAATLHKCPCNCNDHKYSPVCAVDVAARDRDTFPTECHLTCYNCTMDKNYVIVSRGECAVTTPRPTRPTNRNNGRGSR
ncbi:hypothetical protein C0J52_15106, partial [Blattella germanica]